MHGRVQDTQEVASCKTSRKETVCERAVHGKIILIPKLRYVIEGVDRIELAQCVVC